MNFFFFYFFFVLHTSTHTHTDLITFHYQHNVNDEWTNYLISNHHPIFFLCFIQVYRHLQTNEKKNFDNSHIILKEKKDRKCIATNEETWQLIFPFVVYPFNTIFLFVWEINSSVLCACVHVLIDQFGILIIINFFF